MLQNAYVAIVCMYKNRVWGAENETISGILFGLVFARMKNIDVLLRDITIITKENTTYFQVKKQLS